jgi:hypothetical protein
VAGAAPPCLFKTKCNNGWKCIFTLKLCCYGIFLPAQGQECRGFNSPLPLLYYFKLQERLVTLSILFDQFFKKKNLVVVHVCILGFFCPDWFLVYFSLTFMLVHV